MAQTTNFGWQTPDNTDLVKDGALAIRTLGNAIDTSLVDLKGGTTNQILAKNSNTDMDFKWVANDVGDITAVTAGTGLSGGGTSGDVTLTNTVATTFDAKGDLVVGTGADTFAKLVAGSNGETLVADSSATTGLRWNPTNAAGKNVIFNAAFDIWQRGTSFAYPGGTTYTADRWTFGSGAVGRTTSRQTSGLATSLYNIRCQRDSGNTSTSTYKLSQTLESVDSRKFAGKAFTLSFQARAGTNYSAASNALAVEVRTGTGTDQNIDSGFTGSASPVNQTATLTTSWQRFTYTGTASSSATQIGIIFTATPVGTAGANDFFEIAEVQLELGSVATEFGRQTATLAGERSACERYYCRFDSGSTNYNPISHVGQATATTTSNNTFQFPTTMRIAPTSVDGANLSVYGAGSGSTPGFAAVSAIALTRATVNMAELSSTSTGLTLGGIYRLQPNNAAGYVAFSAEL